MPRRVGLTALSLLLLAPLTSEAAGTITGVSVSKTKVKVGEDVTFTLDGTGGGPCTYKREFVGGNWGGGGSVTTMLPHFPHTWSGAFNDKGSSTLTITSGSDPNPCQVEGGAVTANVEIELVQAKIVDWKATPTTYQGSCPAKIGFSGKIEADFAGSVAYTFVRSDGAISPKYYTKKADFVNLKAPVSRSWTLGGPGNTHPSGWMKLKIIYPTPMESPAAHFSVRCSSASRVREPIEKKRYPKPKPGPAPVEKELAPRQFEPVR